MSLSNEENKIEYTPSTPTTAFDFDISYFDDTDITFIDAEALVKVIAPMGLYGALGYRHLDIDGEDKGEAIKADVTFSGPALFVGWQW